MNDDEIPVLNALREQLVAGIARKSGRHRRIPVLVLASVAAVIMLATGLVFAARSRHPARQVATTGPAIGDQRAVPATSTSTTTTVAGPSSTTTRPQDTTTNPPVPTTSSRVGPTTVPPAPTTSTTASTLVIDLADGTPGPNPHAGRIFTVSPGTIIDVDLDYDGVECAPSWPGPPTSSDDAVVTYLSGGRVGPLLESSQGVFRAVQAGTSILTTQGVDNPLNSEPCADIIWYWEISITVT